jgi:hypothetical protein
MADKFVTKSKRVDTPHFNEQGELCVGNECVKLRVPDKGDIEIDLKDCPDEVRKRFAARLIGDNAGTTYKVSKTDEK